MDNKLNKETGKFSDLLLRFPVLLLIVVCMISRLPQLTSPHLLLDPDECVVGLMAKYFMEGRDYSLYFWGQNYGLSIIEVLFIIPFYWLFGIGTLAVKLAMLLLWTIGTIFLYKVFLSVSNDNKLKAICFTLLFICMPAWAVWSMKARGGYLTSFTLSSILLYILFDDKKNKKWVNWLIMGFVLELIYESQSLFLVGLLPLLTYKIIEQRKLSFAFLMALSGLFLFIPLKWYRSSLSMFYDPGFQALNMDKIGEYTMRFPGYLFQSLTGYYYFSIPQIPDTPSSICAVVTIIMLLSLLIATIILLFKCRLKYGLFIFSTFFTFGIYFISIMTETPQFRYLLPTTGFTLLSVCLLTNIVKTSWIVHFVSCPIIIVGFISQLFYYNFEFIPNRRKELQELVPTIIQHKVKYVFSFDDGMLPWQIIFYSDEQVIAIIPMQPPGRHKAYFEEVLNNFYQRKRTAVIGYDRLAPDPDSNKLIHFNEFYLNLSPSDAAIEKEILLGQRILNKQGVNND